MLVDGARQTGKTYLIESFAQAEYDDYVRIVCSWYKMRGSSEFRKPRIVFVISSKAPVWEIIEKGRAHSGAQYENWQSPNR